METNPVKILVIGAGVNGSIVAAKLHNAGVHVTVLARGQRYAALRDQGIIIEDPLKHQRTQAKVPVIDALAPDDVYDYVLVVVRRNQVADLLPVLASNRSPNVVFMHNNPSGPAEYAAIGKERVLLGFVFGAGRREGKVIHGMAATGGWMRMAATPFGEVDGAVTPRVSRLVEILKQAGFNAQVSRHMPDWQASHAILRPSLALPIRRYKLDVRALAEAEASLRLMVDSMPEALDVLHAAGYRLVPGTTGVVRWVPRGLTRALLRWVLPTRWRAHAFAGGTQ